MHLEVLNLSYINRAQNLWNESWTVGVKIRRNLNFQRSNIACPITYLNFLVRLWMNISWSLTSKLCVYSFRYTFWDVFFLFPKFQLKTTSKLWDTIFHNFDVVFCFDRWSEFDLTFVLSSITMSPNTLCMCSKLKLWSCCLIPNWVLLWLILQTCSCLKLLTLVFIELKSM